MCRGRTSVISELPQFATPRAARRGDLAALRDLERAAGALFRAVGMAAVADDEPATVAELAVFADDGRAWVVTDDADEQVGYLLVDVVDGNAHIEQVSVHPDHARQGLGRALVETAAAWADRRGLPALTLTTYAAVPWNAPYYARLGFRVLSDDEMSPGLRRVREDEAARGLAEWPRVAMRCAVRRLDLSR
jgi:GNAT superfamily N-acetyltransferase